MAAELGVPTVPRVEVCCACCVGRRGCRCLPALFSGWLAWLRFLRQMARDHGPEAAGQLAARAGTGFRAAFRSGPRGGHVHGQSRGTMIVIACPERSAQIYALRDWMAVQFRQGLRSPGGMQDGHDQELDVAIVQASGGVAEVNWDAVGKAGGQEQDASFPGFSELVTDVSWVVRGGRVSGDVCALVLCGLDCVLVRGVRGRYETAAVAACYLAVPS